MAGLVRPKNPCLDKLVMPIAGPIAPVNPTTPITQPVQREILTDFTPDPEKSYPNQLWEVKILQICYFPLTVSGLQLDINITGDVGSALSTVRAHVATETATLIDALEEGCHETIAYRVMGRIEVHEGYPLTNGTKYRASGYNPPLVDYEKMMLRFDIADWVAQGINQVWVWGYHGEKVTLWESTMSSTFGNISNSDRNKELPIIAGKTYTVFNYNYGRGAADAMEDHCHQLEQLLNHVDGRQSTPESEWPNLLFWGKFVGSNKTHRLVANNGVYRCGWSHYAPNSIEDYDWHNPRVVTSDFYDWRPEGGGATQQISCANFSCDDDGGMAWKIAWMRAIPRENNGLTFNGKALTNWWSFVGEFDTAMSEQRKLIE